MKANISEALSDHPKNIINVPSPWKMRTIGLIGFYLVVVSIGLTLTGFFYDTTVMRKIIFCSFVFSSFYMYGWLIFNAKAVWSRVSMALAFK